MGTLNYFIQQEKNYLRLEIAVCRSNLNDFINYGIIGDEDESNWERIKKLDHALRLLDDCRFITYNSYKEKEGL